MAGPGLLLRAAGVLEHDRRNDSRRHPRGPPPVCSIGALVSPTHTKPLLLPSLPTPPQHMCLASRCAFDELPTPVSVHSTRTRGGMCPRRYTCHGAGTCVVTLDVCHTASNDNKSCKNGTVSLIPPTSPSSPAVFTAYVDNAGGLSGALTVFFFLFPAGCGCRHNSRESPRHPMHVQSHTRTPRGGPLVSAVHVRAPPPGCTHHTPV